MTTTAKMGYVEVDGYQGLAYIAPGHDLSKETITEWAAEFAEGKPRSEEVFWTHKKRVKWCSRHGDGWGCDEEGEWHGHWFEVAPNENTDTHFTVIWTTS